MTVRFTRRGCKVETRFIIQPNGEVREEITLSVDPLDHMSLEDNKFHAQKAFVHMLVDKGGTPRD